MIRQKPRPPGATSSQLAGLTSSQNVTGPRLTSSTSMSAPKPPEKGLAKGRVGGLLKPRPVAAAGVGSQGELWHQQDASIHLGDVQVHPAPGVRKHPVAHQPLGQAPGLTLGIVSLDCSEDQNTGADGTQGIRAHPDRRGGHSLNEPDHRGTATAKKGR